MAKLYLNYISQPSRAIAVIWRMAEIPVEEIHITLRQRQHLKTDYIKINPLGKVPTMVDDGHTLVESNSILKYLWDKHELSEDLYPRKDLIQRQKVDATLDWSSTFIRPAVLPYIQQTVFRLLLGMGPCPKERLDLITAKAYNSMEQLNKILESPSPYPFFTLNTKTIADLQVFEELHLLHECSDIKVDSYPNIAKWYWNIFENKDYWTFNSIQHYHELMVKQINIDFPNNEIDFTKI